MHWIGCTKSGNERLSEGEIQKRELATCNWQLKVKELIISKMTKYCSIESKQQVANCQLPHKS
jgi:hypothetical protein